MKSSFLGMLASACWLTPKFFATTSGGVCAIQSESRTVSYSEKFPSAKTRRNSQPAGPNAWREEPKLVFFDVGDETFAIGIDASDARRSIKHKGPFRSGVPMQLADAA